VLRLDGNTGAPGSVVRYSTDEGADSSSLTGKPSIAVLAFTNMSEDRDQEFFSDGIADDIITELSRSRSLFVIARNSSFAYKGRSVDIKQVARTGRALVEGSSGGAATACGSPRSWSGWRLGIASGPNEPHAREVTRPG
jgi:hypothetical protein